MKVFIKIILATVIVAAIIAGAVLLFNQYDIAVLNPQGEIAKQQRDLIIFTVLLGLVVVIPVFVMLGVFSWRYRDTNKRATYRPNWSSNKWLELVWWGIPCVIIAILSIVTWQTSHTLDPYRKISSSEKPVSIQVVALQWKWLFIYPEQGIATVNMMQFPAKTPLNFTLTADAPMNAFWIPSLGSQVYAMSGMSSKLHLIADNPGDYKGYSTNISGEGYADMKFTARAGTEAEFDQWVKNIKQSPKNLDMNEYTQLAKADTPKDPGYYRLADTDLYDKIIRKYMSHSGDMKDSQLNTDDLHHDTHTKREMEHR